MRNTLLPLLAAVIVSISNAGAALVAHYDFNGNTNDASGNLNNGVVHGASLTTDRFGRADSAYLFDGVDDFIQANASILPTGSRTVAFWFLADAVANHPVMLGYGGGGCGTSFFVGLNAVPTIYNNSFYVSSHCDRNNLISKYQTEPVDSWRHVAITTDGSGTKMYLNGTLAASNNNFINNTNVTGKDLAIGVDVSPGGFAPYTDRNVGYFSGKIDDVRIYDNALRADEIARIVPEPTTIALIVAGIGLVGLRSMRRSAKRRP